MTHLYRYTFQTQVQFSKAVNNHHFLLRCIPYECMFQRNIEQTCEVSDSPLLCRDTDAFGNTLLYGFISDFHNEFSFISRGYIEVHNYCANDVLNRIYLYSSPLTIPSVAISYFLKQNDKESLATVERVLFLTNRLHDFYSYKPNVTNSFTTAAEAFAGKYGVCQDYAHILIVLCRMVGIPARYVNGFMIGEGVSHAWVEIYDNGLWYGVDPTHNKIINDGYIKLAHGRDASDCAINRGLFTGYTTEKSSISISVEKEF